MAKMTVYHGGYQAVKNPEIRKGRNTTMSLTLAKAEIVIIINYDSCFFTFDMGILIPCFYYSYLFS